MRHRRAQCACGTACMHEPVYDTVSAAMARLDVRSTSPTDTKTTGCWIPRESGSHDTVAAACLQACAGGSPHRVGSRGGVAQQRKEVAVLRFRSAERHEADVVLGACRRTHDRVVRGWQRDAPTVPGLACSTDAARWKFRRVWQAEGGRREGANATGSAQVLGPDLIEQRWFRCAT